LGLHPPLEWFDNIKKPIMMPELPLVTIITPSYNMGRYIRETIESVLNQDYPHLEYIVMDGGSTDETLSILEQYRERLQYFSAPDQGAAEAINLGLKRSRGSIFAYLNADDTYLPAAVSTAVRYILDSPDAAGVYGNAYWIDQAGKMLGAYPTRDFDPHLLRTECFICQPAAFLRREAFEQAGMMDIALQYTFDYDLWVRLARQQRMRHIDDFLATSRMHKENKTLGARRQVLAETLRMLRGHFGYVPFSWVHAYSAHLLDGRDQFFEQPQPSIAKYLLSLFLGLWYNRWLPFRFLKEWSAVMSMGGLLRAWKGFFSR
jgi:glycosyltransferase involved in cell wall biosynthesis